jgi:peroxiredoxin
MVAVSVDAPEKSESVRRELQLPFPILSDSRRRVVRQWGIYNPDEKGGIAKPAVFILAPDRTVLFVSVDEVASRVPAAEILRRLSEPGPGPGAKRKTKIPGPALFFRAVRNALRMGMVQREK